MIGLLLIALLAIVPAQAKTKAVGTRVTEAFQDLRWQPRRQELRLRAPPIYIANRPSFFVAGKLMIYRECEVDRYQDPGEHSCRPVWAWI